jgi:hypothetical protein
MASVIAPIAGAVLSTALGSLGPLVAKAASGLINVAEAYLPKGTKLQAVLAGLQAFVTPLGGAGAVQQPTTFTQAQLEAIIEGVLAQMKAEGTLVPPLSGLAPVAPPAAPTSAGTQQSLQLPPLKVSWGQ